MELGGGLGEHVLERIAAQDLARHRGLDVPARGRIGEEPAQVVPRQTDGMLASQRLRQAQVDELVVDELANQRRRDPLEAAGEDALLDARGDLLGARACEVGLGHQGGHDAAPAPRPGSVRHVDARRARRVAGFPRRLARVLAESGDGALARSRAAARERAEAGDRA